MKVRGCKGWAVLLVVLAPLAGCADRSGSTAPVPAELLPAPEAYVKGLPPGRVSEICRQLFNLSPSPMKDVRSELRSKGTATEAEIQQRAEEILRYIDDERC